MKHHANPRFWKAYRGLPADIRTLADRNYALLKTDPTHRSLHFEKIGTLRDERLAVLAVPRGPWPVGTAFEHSRKARRLTTGWELR